MSLAEIISSSLNRDSAKVAEAFESDFLDISAKEGGRCDKYESRLFFTAKVIRLAKELA